MDEPNVSREEIRERAWAAAERGLALQSEGTNPYAPGTLAHHRFELDFLDRERQLLAEATP